MISRADIDAAAAVERLFVSGIVAEEGRSVVLLSPDEPGFWPHFQNSPEARDAAPDPLDRWSVRVIGELAEAMGGEALFPFGGPPWHPFPAWALASQEAWTAPVGLIVHRRSGLFASYRGAIALPDVLQPAVGAESPCPTCARPCVTACPVDAFDGAVYDVPRCKRFLETDAGRVCRDGGCQVRCACPVGAGRRSPEQSAFHMKAFHPHAA